MRKIIYVAGLLALVVGGFFLWQWLSKPALPPGFAGGNGRLEAKQVDIATKYPGRIKKVLVDEGDTVDAGQVVATMDTEPLEAQLREAKAKIREAQDNRRTALAEVAVKQSELAYADKQYKRSKELVVRGAVSEQERDIDLPMPRSQVRSSGGAGAGGSDTIRDRCGDSGSRRIEGGDQGQRVKGPHQGARPESPGRAGRSARRRRQGTGAGRFERRVYVCLSSRADAGKVALGSEARIVLDAVPEYPIRALGFIRFAQRTIHAQDRRDGRGAPQPDFPSEAAA